MNNSPNEKLTGLKNILTDIKNVFTDGEPSLISSIGMDRGEIGEYRSEYVLNNRALTNICKIQTVHNVYLKDNGLSTEIDVIAVTEKGIFVIESKNYGGKIYGDENSLKWMQYFPNGTKHQFYNPIKQNRNHIKKLSSYLSLNDNYFISYIVFSNRCELRKVPKNYPGLNVIKREQLLWFIKSELQVRQSVFTEEQCNYIFQKLNELSGVADEIKNQHIEQIHNIQAGLICPYCGKELIKRNGKYGEFYGCSGYPKCRYTKKI